MKLSKLTSIAFILGGVIATLAYGQGESQQPGIVGTWYLVHIESAGPDAKHPERAQPTGMLIYTPDGHASVQLMYPETSLSNEFVHDGYEATFGTYELDERKHRLVYHIHGSATREKLVGKSETLHYDFPDNRHMIIRPTQADQHWSVTWERY
ncbi:MAG TPA: lipocalin-like domain-containing protein [Bryobacteraceae bacterium]|nr:lipocalin-like domain-containing protein [Bryobacteraceae bacterium]